MRDQALPDSEGSHSVRWHQAQKGTFAKLELRDLEELAERIEPLSLRMLVWGSQNFIRDGWLRVCEAEKSAQLQMAGRAVCFA